MDSGWRFGRFRKRFWERGRSHLEGGGWSSGSGCGGVPGVPQGLRSPYSISLSSRCS